MSLSLPKKCLVQGRKISSKHSRASEAQSLGHLLGRGRRILTQRGFQDLSLSDHLGIPSLSDLLSDSPAKIREFQPDTTRICVSILLRNIGNRYRVLTSHRVLQGALHLGSFASPRSSRRSRLQRPGSGAVLCRKQFRLSAVDLVQAISPDITQLQSNLGHTWRRVFR